MIIFLYGPDTYRSQEKLKQIIVQYKKAHKNKADLRYFEEENLEFQKFKNIVEQNSIFNEKKLLILINSFNNQDFKEKLIRDCKKFSQAKDIIVFYEKNKILPKDKLFSCLKKTAEIQKFEFLQGEKLKKWAEKEFSGLNLQISQAALSKLLNFVGDDLWRFSNEIKKIAAYKKNKQVFPQDIDLLVKANVETAIFKTIDAIADRNKKKAFLLIKQHLDKGDNPLYLLSMITFQFRNLLIVKDLIERNQPYYAILKTTHFHPFLLRKTYQQSNRFTLGELEKIYQRIFQADFDIKTGKAEPGTALEMLIAKL